jgi:hypothetical protein
MLVSYLVKMENEKYHCYRAYNKMAKWQNDLNINKSRQHSVNSKVNYAWNSAINGLGIIIL